jgi:hypothetical protein
MKLRFLCWVVLLVLWCPIMARAHLGSSDIFFDGKVGPWPARITIRMPVVVPGRAEIITEIQSHEPVTVSFTPISARTVISNAPPAELAVSVPGETNVFTGDLWLMTFGAYSIEVRIHGASGDGTVQIPVNSAATAQLPLPPWLGGALLALGLVLCLGAMAIVGAAAGESTLPATISAGQTNLRKYWTAAIITAVVLVLALVGGKKWWDVEANNFRKHLTEGAWPDLAANVRPEGSQRILQLTLGRHSFAPGAPLALARDHGKLLHFFLVGLPDHQAFAHLHPVRKGNTTFEVALPPLPEGDYEIFCDLTLASGLSSTATNWVHLPAIAINATELAHSAATTYLAPDPDDSWATNSTIAAREIAGGDTTCRLPDGMQVIWKAHPSLRVNQDARLKFEVRDAAGQPAHLEPYMGMTSHAAVLRSDGRVFAHLHPSGNFSMAAQMFFNAKLAGETGAAGARSDSSTNTDQMMTMPDGSVMKMSDMPPAGNEDSTISLPYQFPSAGDYRVWVQIKVGEQVMTAIFDTTVK